MNHRLTVTAAAATVLASIAMYPLISRTGWFFDGAGAAILVAAIGTLTRLRALPVVVCLLAALAGVFLYVNILFAWPESLYRLIPTPASAHQLIWLVGRARSEMAKYAPPVPARTGIYLLATAGIGIVAAATDLVAVRLRRPALAGLPLLVLFCVPLTTDAHPSGVSAAVVFSLGIAGYLALLSADGRERVRLWGRIVHTWPGKPETRGPDTRQLTAAGRRVGFAAVVLALCVPLILPALRHHRLFPSSGTGNGAGHVGALALPDPLVEMNQDLRTARPETVLTYRTNATSRPPYFQVYVLGRLGTAWSLTPPSATAAAGGGTLPAVPGLSHSTRSFTVRETVTLSPTLRGEKHAVSYLPVPYAPRSVTVPGNWRVDTNSLSILSTTTALTGLQYTVASRNIDPSAQQLRLAGSPPTTEDGYLAVPRPYRQLLPLTKRITAGHDGAYSRAVALQEWFTEPGNFTYSLTAAQPNGASGLMTFLTKTKRGYCQQFAFAMAVMARLAGIPSRVVVGYTQGVHQANDTWLVRTSDAHAWPELYFQGAGWLRFEPTPSGAPGQAGGQATAVAPAYSIPPLGSIVPTQKPSSSVVSPSARPSASASAGGIGSKERQLSGTGGTGRAAAAALPIVLLIIVVLAVAAVTPRATRSLTRRRRWFMAGDDTGRAHAAWLEFRDDLTDHRIACRASESPRALARRVGESLGLAAADRQALERIARAEERAHYARTPVGSAELRNDVATARRAVAKACSLPARCAAMALPASVLAPARAALTHVLDVFGWMDVLTTSLQHRASGRRAPAARS